MATSYTQKYGGAVYLTFNGENIVLTAADLKKPNFSYVADSFYDAVNLGKIQDAINSILTKFDSTVGGIVNPTEIENQLNTLKANIPPLAALLDSNLLITQFVIQPPATGQTGKYAFGIGLQLTSNNTLGPVTLDGISFSVELNQTS